MERDTLKRGNDIISEINKLKWRIDEFVNFMKQFSSTRLLSSNGTLIKHNLTLEMTETTAMGLLTWMNDDIISFEKRIEELESELKEL